MLFGGKGPYHQEGSQLLSPDEPAPVNASSPPSPMEPLQKSAVEVQNAGKLLASGRRPDERELDEAEAHVHAPSGIVLAFGWSELDVNMVISNPFYNPKGLSLSPVEIELLRDLIDRYRERIGAEMQEYKRIEEECIQDKIAAGDYVKDPHKLPKYIPPGGIKAGRYLPNGEKVYVVIVPGEFPVLDEQWKKLGELGKEGGEAIREFFRRR